MHPNISFSLYVIQCLRKHLTDCQGRSKPDRQRIWCVQSQRYDTQHHWRCSGAKASQRRCIVVGSNTTTNIMLSFSFIAAKTCQGRSSWGSLRFFLALVRNKCVGIGLMSLPIPSLISVHSLYPQTNQWNTYWVVRFFVCLIDEVSDGNLSWKDSGSQCLILVASVRNRLYHIGIVRLAIPSQVDDYFLHPQTIKEGTRNNTIPASLFVGAVKEASDGVRETPEHCFGMANRNNL